MRVQPACRGRWAQSAAPAVAFSPCTFVAAAGERVRSRSWQGCERRPHASKGRADTHRRGRGLPYKTVKSRAGAGYERVS
jgi:hypothetical protein